MDLDLYEKFYDLVKQIPRGMVTTYGDLAQALGDIIASRAVGKMLSENPLPVEIPCHRVVMHDGSLGGFTHPEGIKKKIELLKEEGVEIEKGMVKNFQEIRFKDFRTDYPLKIIRENEENLKKMLRIEDYDYEEIIVTDVSYAGRNAFVGLIKLKKNLEIIKFDVKKIYVNFPYIPTYLSYREGNAIVSVLDEKGLIVLDGQGIMHPRGFGLASYVGVIMGMPSIGIAKSYLSGTVDRYKVFMDNTQVGWKIGKYYVSPGNMVSINSSKELASRILKRKLNSLAHRIATKSRDEYCSSYHCGPFS